MLWEYFRMHPLVLSIGIMGAAVYAFGTVASAVVLGRITDSVIVPAFHGGVSGPTVSEAAAAILGVALLRGAGIVVRRFFAGVTKARVSRDLRTRVLDKYAALPVAYHRSQPTGDLLAHAHADVEAASEVIGPLPYSTAVVLLIVLATVLLIATDPVLALVGCAVLPGVAVVNHVYMARIEPPAERAQHRVGDLSAVAHESIDGALVVKTLGREDAEVRRFAAQAERLREQRVALGIVRARFEPLLDALPDTGTTLLLALGAWRVATGAISTGTLVQFLALFQLLAFPMRLIGFLLGDMVRALVARDRIRVVEREPVTLHTPAHPVVLPAGPIAVDVEDLHFAYDGAPAVLRSVSFVVPARATVALTGATGSGKSTLVELVGRLADPQRGGILVGGVDLRDVDPESFRAAVAVVFQESFLFATTLRENVTLDLPVSDADIDRALRLAQAKGFVSALPEGVDTRVGERGVTLSGGQRQRIALARALVRRPRLLVLDDATSAVDPTLEAAILDALRTELDTTLLVVAHRGSTIRLADSVVFLEDGRVAATGRHLELLEHPGYAALLRAYETERCESSPAASAVSGGRS
jgi:ABC-type multidrug transport system fused ATPase/permease subunit